MPEPSHGHTFEDALKNAIDSAMRRTAPAIGLRLAELAMEELERTLDRNMLKELAAARWPDAPSGR